MTYLILPSLVVDDENLAICREMLESLAFHTADYTLIGIDNGSIPEAKELLQKHSHIFVSFSHPLGYARAVNIGWRMVEELVDAQYVGVLNNDLTFTPGWLEALQQHLDEKTAACASYDSRVGNIVTNHIWSSCFLMLPETRKNIGYFDAENLPYRYHDQDYWIRAKKLGLEFKRIGASQVGHKESTTYKKMPEKANETNEYQIMQKRYGVTMAQGYN